MQIKHAHVCLVLDLIYPNKSCTPYTTFYKTYLTMPNLEFHDGSTWAMGYYAVYVLRNGSPSQILLRRKEKFLKNFTVGNKEIFQKSSLHKVKYSWKVLWFPTMHFKSYSSKKLFSFVFLMSSFVFVQTLRNLKCI